MREWGGIKGEKSSICLYDLTPLVFYVTKQNGKKVIKLGILNDDKFFYIYFCIHLLDHRNVSVFWVGKEEEEEESKAKFMSFVLLPSTLGRDKTWNSLLSSSCFVFSIFLCFICLSRT